MYPHERVLLDKLVAAGAIRSYEPHKWTDENRHGDLIRGEDIRITFHNGSIISFSANVEGGEPCVSLNEVKSAV